MAGLYIHIPFCAKACHYCDFHFSVNFSKVSSFVDALLNEIKHKSCYFSDLVVETIYFGGGSPSILNVSQLDQILSVIYENYKISEKPEITFEINPDDACLDYLLSLFNLKINRLSIGIQTFNQHLLQQINRNHTSEQSFLAIENAFKAGFSNISCDLIYAYPSIINDCSYQSNAILENDIAELLKFEITHISAYQLTLEPKTVFGKWFENGKIQAIKEENALLQFDYLIQTLQKNGFEQYEISNFSKKDFHSKHNSAYWFGKSYLGFGPSAHSFLQNERWATISDNNKYIDFWKNPDLKMLQNIQNIEILSKKDFINEHILTRLRTKWGLDIHYIYSLLDESQKLTFDKEVQSQIAFKNVTINNESLILTSSGKNIADNVALKLFIT